MTIQQVSCDEPLWNPFHILYRCRKIEIRQLPRLTPTVLRALPRLTGKRIPLLFDGEVLNKVGLLDILIDVRRAEVLLLLDNREADNFRRTNTCLLIGRGFSNLDYPYPRRQREPIGVPIDSHWMIPYRGSLHFIAKMGGDAPWDFSFSATRIDFFALDIPGLIDPPPSCSNPDDNLSETSIEENMPRWTSKAKIRGISILHYNEFTWQ